MIEYLNQNFVNVKINKDQNEEIASRYGVRGIPATLFLDETGAKVSEIGGYLPPEPFLEALKKIMDGVKKLADLDARIAKDPSDIAALVEAGKLCLESGAVEKATERLQKALDGDKENQKGLAADAHFHLGYCRLKQGDVPGAKQHFAETTRLDPEGKRGFADDIRMVELDVILRQKQGEGKLADVLPDLEKFLADFPQSDLAPQALFYKGMLLWQTGSRQEGFDVLEAMAAAHPDTQWAKMAAGKYLPGMEAELKKPAPPGEKGGPKEDAPK